MTYALRFLPAVEEDALAGYTWYEERNPGLGEEFLRMFYACAREIFWSQPGRSERYRLYTLDLVGNSYLAQPGVMAYPIAELVKTMLQHQHRDHCTRKRQPCTLWVLTSEARLRTSSCSTKQRAP